MAENLDTMYNCTYARSYKICAAVMSSFLLSWNRFVEEATDPKDLRGRGGGVRGG